MMQVVKITLRRSLQVYVLLQAHKQHSGYGCEFILLFKRQPPEFLVFVVS